MKKKLFSIILVCTLCLTTVLLSGCDSLFNRGSQSETKFTVSFDANGGAPINDINASKIQSSPVTSKEGYEFSGWFSDSSLQTKVKFPLTVVANMNLYAKWSKQNFTVKFDSNGGSKVDDFFGSTLTSSPITTKTGFNFSEWRTSDYRLVEFPFEILKDLTLKAYWTEKKPTIVTLTFNSNGGSDVRSFTKKSDSSASSTKPQDPTRTDGKEFLGWFKESNLINLASFPFSFSEDTTLYAKWSDFVRKTDAETKALIGTQFEEYSIEVLVRLCGSFGYGISKSCYGYGYLSAYAGEPEYGSTNATYRFDPNYSVTPEGADSTLFANGKVARYNTSLDSIRGGIYTDPIPGSQGDDLLKYASRWEWSYFYTSVHSGDMKNYWWEFSKFDRVYQFVGEYYGSYINTYRKQLEMNIYEIMLGKGITPVNLTASQIDEKISSYLTEYYSSYSYYGFSKGDAADVSEFILRYVVGGEVLRHDLTAYLYNRDFFKNYEGKIKSLVAESVALSRFQKKFTL